MEQVPGRTLNAFSKSKPDSESLMFGIDENAFMEWGPYEVEDLPLRGRACARTE